MSTTYLARFQAAVRANIEECTGYNYNANDRTSWNAILTLVLEIWDAARQHNLDPRLDDWLEGLSEENCRRVADEAWNEPDVSLLAARLDHLNSQDEQGRNSS